MRRAGAARQGEGSRGIPRAEERAAPPLFTPEEALALLWALDGVSWMPDDATLERAMRTARGKVEPMATQPCRSCRAPVIWALSVKQKPMPIDAVVPDAFKGKENIRLEQARGGTPQAVVVAPGTGTHTAHHATCPDGKAWKR